jgi:hypothetical protein
MQARCAIVYVSRTHPGACSLIEADPMKIDVAYQMFRNLLEYWRLKNNHA